LNAQGFFWALHKATLRITFLILAFLWLGKIGLLLGWLLLAGWHLAFALGKTVVGPALNQALSKAGAIEESPARQ
jgi:hypothetical protein